MVRLIFDINRAKSDIIRIIFETIGEIFDLYEDEV
jgi:hypothetical protein